MKISYNWLRELISFNLDADKVADLLTGCGLEVEGTENYESVRGGLKGVVVGHVLTCVRHPNADKLSLTTVDIGTGTPVQIVCGAPNVAAGQKVLVATVGTTLYPSKGEPMEIKKAKIRGELSEGMICAEDELGMGNSHAGIMVLTDAYETGQPASVYFPVYSDTVLEIGLTANRGDAASHLGVARDLKALTNIPVHLPKVADLKSSAATEPFKVDLQDTRGCLRYSGMALSGVEVKASPDWLKHKLSAIGIASINNIVDATNYVLHELGQPLHAFDTDQLAGKSIVIRQAVAGEKITTLDQTERTLQGTECIIADSEQPIAIAGVFGGINSGITTATRNIFIESACFAPAIIRKTARHHGLQTDASYRFERGTDPEITLTALARAVHLIQEIAGGEMASSVTDLYPEAVKPATVRFSMKRFETLMGQPIPHEEIVRILNNLEIAIDKKSDDLLLLTIPPYRSDVTREADVAEEILRIYGLNNIAIPAQLKSTLTRSADEDAYVLRNRIANFLADTGFNEMMSNSLTASAYYIPEELEQAVFMLNPLSTDLDVMRVKMLFNGMEMIRYNSNRRINSLRAFEFGFTYARTTQGYHETPHLALYLTGDAAPESWIQPKRACSYFHIKSHVEQILLKAGIKTFQFKTGELSFDLNQNTQVICGKEILGNFGSVDSRLLKKFDIEQPVFYADLLWEPIRKLALKPSFELEPVIAFPPVRRDLALLIDKAVTYAEIERVARSTEKRLLKQMDVFDVYEGDKIPKDKKSYAVSFMLHDDTKTLTDKEIDAVMQKLIQQFGKTFGATLRT